MFLFSSSRFLSKAIPFQERNAFKTSVSKEGSAEGNRRQREGRAIENFAWRHTRKTERKACCKKYFIKENIWVANFESDRWHIGPLWKRLEQALDWCSPKWSLSWQDASPIKHVLFPTRCIQKTVNKIKWYNRIVAHQIKPIKVRMVSRQSDLQKSLFNHLVGWKIITA